MVSRHSEEQIFLSRALLIWAPPFCQTPPPPPASEDRLEIALADASAKSRMMHLLALLVALICDSEVSATPFSAAQFRELWEEPCIARLQDYQDSGMISPAISEEIDTFCEFMKRVTMVIPACSAEEAERIANMCWTAVNEVCRSHPISRTDSHIFSQRIISRISTCHSQPQNRTRPLVIIVCRLVILLTFFQS